MSVYRCLSCGQAYGYHPQLPRLRSIHPESHLRYTDSDVWQCPHCNSRQDSRDIQPFMGLTGGGTVKLLNAEEIEHLHPEFDKFILMTFGRGKGLI